MHHINIDTSFCLLSNLIILFHKRQRIQYAKSKSDAVSKLEGTYIQREKKPREKRKAPEQGKSWYYFSIGFCLHIDLWEEDHWINTDKVSLNFHLQYKPSMVNFDIDFFYLIFCFLQQNQPNDRQLPSLHLQQWHSPSLHQLRKMVTAIKNHDHSSFDVGASISKSQMQNKSTFGHYYLWENKRHQSTVH